MEDSANRETEKWYQMLMKVGIQISVANERWWEWTIMALDITQEFDATEKKPEKNMKNRGNLVTNVSQITACSTILAGQKEPGFHFSQIEKHKTQSDDNLKYILTVQSKRSHAERI